MSTNLFRQVDERVYGQLLADESGAEIEAVVLAPGSGDVPMGTIVVKGTGGFYAPAKAEDITPTAMMAITGATAQTGSEASGTGVIVDAYKKGKFLKRHVRISTGAEPTGANMAVLSNVGLMLKESISAEGAYPVFDAEVPKSQG